MISVDIGYAICKLYTRHLNLPPRKVGWFKGTKFANILHYARSSWLGHRKAQSGYGHLIKLIVAKALIADD